MRKLKARKKRIIAIGLIFIMLFISGCNRENDNNSTSATEDGTDTVLETEENNRRILDLYAIKKAADLYSEAANMVKSQSAGFTRSEWQKITNIKTGDTTGLANRILDIVASNVLTSEEDAFGGKAEKVQKGNTNRINLLFPVYNRDYACQLEKKYDCISSAEYKKVDGNYEITIYFADALNAEQDTDGFGKIMTPFIRTEILDAIEKYVWIADLDALALDFLYRDCYLTCVIDAKTKHILSMEQHITAYLDATAEVNVLGFTTNFLNGTATVENHLYFYDFEW